MALQVQVSTMTGIVHDIWVDEKCTVQQVKAVLEERVGIPCPDQVLLRDCTRLNNEDAPFMTGDISPLMVICVKSLDSFRERTGYTDINAFTGPRNGYTLLMVAALLDEPLFCVEVLENPNFMRVNHTDLQGRTILHLAAARGHTFEDVCVAVLAHKDFTKASAPDVSGRTALHYAVESGLHSVSARLLAHDSTMACSLTRSSRTALHVAAEKGDLACCTALLDVGTAKQKQTLLFMKDGCSSGTPLLLGCFRQPPIMLQSTAGGGR